MLYEIGYICLVHKLKVETMLSAQYIFEIRKAVLKNCYFVCGFSNYL